MTCPCCSNKNYSDCCGRFIDGQQFPTTPEELMRSRYTAFTQANIKYIVATMKSPAADNFNVAEAEQWAKNTTWKKLEVITATQNKNKGFVEFIAYITDKNKDEIIYERSEFHLEKDQWYYINGVIPRKKKSAPIVSPNKPGRNDNCPCGSGKKYKKCCE